MHGRVVHDSGCGVWFARLRRARAAVRVQFFIHALLVPSYLIAVFYYKFHSEEDGHCDWKDLYRRRCSDPKVDCWCGFAEVYFFWLPIVYAFVQAAFYGASWTEFVRQVVLGLE